MMRSKPLQGAPVRSTKKPPAQLGRSEDTQAGVGGVLSSAFSSAWFKLANGSKFKSIAREECLLMRSAMLLMLTAPFFFVHPFFVHSALAQSLAQSSGQFQYLRPSRKVLAPQALAAAARPIRQRAQACRVMVRADTTAEAVCGASASPEFAEQMKKYHFVFVGGMFSEIQRMLPEHMRFKLRFIEDCYQASYQSVWPSSFQSIPANAQLLHQQVVEAYENYSKPLIIFAHSKGAAEVLHLLLNHPELVAEKKVARVILLQPALKGSRWVQELLESHRHDPAFCNGVPKCLGRGFASLDPRTAQVELAAAYQRFEGALARMSQKRESQLSSSSGGGGGDGSIGVGDDDGDSDGGRRDQVRSQVIAGEKIREQVSRSVTYLRSQEQAESVSPLIKLLWRLLPQTRESRLEEASDGVLGLDAQFFAGIGYDLLGIFQGDHFSFFRKDHSFYLGCLERIFADLMSLDDA